MTDDQISEQINRIKLFMDAFYLEPSEIGILLNPAKDNLAYHVRTRNGADTYAAMDYKVGIEELENPYSDWVERFQDEPSDEIQLQYVEINSFNSNQFHTPL